MIYVKTSVGIDGVTLSESNIQQIIDSGAVFGNVSKLQDHGTNFTLVPGDDLQAIANINADIVTTRSLVPSSGSGNIVLNKPGYYEIIVFHNNVGYYNWRSYIRAYDFPGVSGVKADWNSSHIHNVYVSQDTVTQGNSDIAVIITIEELDPASDGTCYPSDWFIGFKYYPESV